MPQQINLTQKKTLIMGVMNLTPDSFSNDGRLSVSRDPKSHLRFALKMFKDGADIIDVGAQSSRPLAKSITVKEELGRLLPTLKLLTRHSAGPVSVDTYAQEAAHAALDLGVEMINNIHGCRPDKRLVKHVIQYGAFLCLMHSRGTPRNMHTKAKYRDVVADVMGELKETVDFCMDLGLKKDKIILDPGIGFAKTLDQNLKLLNNLDKFKRLWLPILVGTSRKSFIGKILNADEQHRAWGTAATVSAAILKGARIVRVHDVKEMKQVVQMTDAIYYS